MAYPDELQESTVKDDEVLINWANKHTDSFPAEIARDCGIEQFEVQAASESYLAVIVRPEFFDAGTINCLRSRGGDYVRLALVDPELA